MAELHSSKDFNATQPASSDHETAAPTNSITRHELLAAISKLCAADNSYALRDSGNISVERRVSRDCVLDVKIGSEDSSQFLVRRSSSKELDAFLAALLQHLPEDVTMANCGFTLTKDLGSDMIDLIEHLALRSGEPGRIIFNGDFGDSPGDSSYMFVEYHPNSEQEVWVNIYVKRDELVDTQRDVVLEINLVLGDESLQRSFGSALKIGLERQHPNLKITLNYSATTKLG